MIIRQLEQAQYNRFCTALNRDAHAEPLDACYTVSLNINHVDYAVKVQPERHNKIAVLQALRLDRAKDSLNFELITSGCLPSSFLEILLYQGIGAPAPGFQPQST